MRMGLGRGRCTEEGVARRWPRAVLSWGLVGAALLEKLLCPWGPDSRGHHTVAMLHSGHSGPVPRGFERRARARTTVRCPPGAAGTAALLQVPRQGAMWAVGPREGPGV